MKCVTLSVLQMVLLRQLKFAKGMTGGYCY